MGTENLGDWTKSLIAHGMPPETPVAIVESGTLGKQKSVSGTLATIARLAAEKKISPPALTVVGDVVKLRGKLNWFENLPLFGKRIVVTRSRAQMAKFSQKLSELGAEVLEIPAVKGVDPDNKQDFIDALLVAEFLRLAGVHQRERRRDVFSIIFFRRFHDLRDIGGAKIAAVGPATAAKLRELHLQVDLMPEEFIGRKIAEAFAKHGSIENTKICLLRAENANPRPAATRWKKWARSWTTSASTKPSPRRRIFPARRKIFWRAARTGSRSQAARPWNFSTRGLICRS